MYIYRKIRLLIFCGFMMSGFCAKAELFENRSDKVIDGFASFYYQAENGQMLKYRFYNPVGKNNNKKYPLVVHFHGAGSRGDNNISQISLAKKVNRKKYPCFVFAPQCPAGKKWVSTDWTKLSHKMASAPNDQMAMAMAAIDEIIKKYPIDTRRIYVYGQSMGGFATWEIISRRPDMFAAAVPVCGGADETLASRITHIPVWVFHGKLDPIVKVERSRNMVNALQTAGGKPKYTEFPNVKHNAWSYAYTSELFQWMFEQKLPQDKN